MYIADNELKPCALIYLTNAGHYIHFDDPRSIVDNMKILIERLGN